MQDTSFNVLGSDIQTAEIDDGAVTAAKIAAGTLSWNAFIFGQAPTRVTQGTWAHADTTNEWFADAFSNSTSADGDGVEYDFYLPAGTYTIYFGTSKNATRGIADFLIDDVEVASFDTYASSSTTYQIMTQASVNVTTTGAKTLKIVLDGKNASSSDFFLRIGWIGFIRTGDAT